MVSDFAFYLYIMAPYQIPDPSPTSVRGDIAENWKDFENSWECFVIATDLRSKLNNDEGKKIVAATLCTVMGADSLPSLSAADKKDPAKIIQELKKHFIPQRNVLHKPFVFNSALQKPDETIDKDVVHLRQMAELCKFGTLKDSDDHTRKDCPAKDAKCHLSQKKRPLCHSLSVIQICQCSG